MAVGGMAGVFRARDDRLHREVAIKLIRDRAGMPEMRERLMREARVVSGLTHPNICTIFDIGEQDGELYLVLELLEGETLRERIAARPVLGRSTVYPMAESGLARALAETGDTAGRASAYDRFLVLWKDVDADPGPGVAVVQEARLGRRSPPMAPGRRPNCAPTA